MVLVMFYIIDGGEDYGGSYCEGEGGGGAVVISAFAWNQIGGHDDKTHREVIQYSHYFVREIYTIPLTISLTFNDDAALLFYLFNV